VGFKVSFEGRDGPILGILSTINRKSVIVLSDDGTKQYKVSPRLLRPLLDVKEVHLAIEWTLTKVNIYVN
tara:strand:+ start:13486 stop:13695 length:210 start_codon:yes stop_codon:yes gene_type:complete